MLAASLVTGCASDVVVEPVALRPVSSKLMATPPVPKCDLPDRADYSPREVSTGNWSGGGRLLALGQRSQIWFPRLQCREGCLGFLLRKQVAFRRSDPLAFLEAGGSAAILGFPQRAMVWRTGSAFWMPCIALSAVHGLADDLAKLVDVDGGCLDVVV